MIQLGLEFLVGQENEDDNRNPALCHDSVFAGSEEALDVLIVVDRFKKQLFLPPLPLDIGSVAKSALYLKHLTTLLSPVVDPFFQAGDKEDLFRSEPVLGSSKEIFDLDYWWMRASTNNRRLFVAMGLTIQMHQLIAYHESRSI